MKSLSTFLAPRRQPSRIFWLVSTAALALVLTHRLQVNIDTLVIFAR